MAKDRKPAEEWSGPAEQTMVQARTAVDTYFDYLKKLFHPHLLVEQSLVKNSKVMRRRMSPRLMNL
jgi:hypothetical protein